MPSHEERQEALALLILLALGARDIEAGDVVPIEDAVERLRARRTNSQ